MKAEVFVVGQSADNRVWDSTYADLQRSPVGNMICDGVADSGLGRTRFRSGYLNQRVVDLYGSREPRHMDYRVAETEWHVGVELGDNRFCAFGGGGCQVGGNAEAHIALFVGHGAVEQYDVDRPCAVAEQCRHLSEEPRSRGTVAFGNPSAHIVRHKACVDKE